MNTLTDAQKICIETLSENMEAFITRCDSLDGKENLIRENLGFVQTIRTGEYSPIQLCGQLRASALVTQHTSPVIAAHLELLAEEFQSMAAN